jgi:glutamate-ammonia-ligase adenylyltransferase
LQITHGKDYPDVRLSNTRDAMAALAQAGVLREEDYPRLRKAHTFLRWMIDALRVVRGNARDVTVPPDDSEEFAFLGRRMPYGNDSARLREALAHYTKDVQEINNRVLKV